MRLEDWELTIQKIVDESKQEPKKGGKHKVLTAWRVKLGREPTSLQPQQIDKIVQEVRRRLGNTGR